MSTPRRLAREIALQILYRQEIDGTPLQETDIHQHLQHFSVKEEVHAFIRELSEGVFRVKAELDALIEKHAQNWKISRMDLIDRNLLRMAIFELKYCTDIPSAVTIDEAIELAKQFGSAETPSFVNGILDAIRKEIGRESER